MSQKLYNTDLMEFLNLDIESHSNRVDAPMHQTIKRSVNFSRWQAHEKLKCLELFVYILVTNL